MIRAYISISTGSHVYKYVSDMAGDSYYFYGDTLNNALDNQGDTAGQVLFDFEALKSNIVGTARQFVTFPESTPTQNLIRRNFDQALGKDDYDTDPDITPVSVLAIRQSGVRSLSIIEERVSPFTQKDYNLNPGPYKRDERGTGA